jgi:hypothetical protein
MYTNLSNEVEPVALDVVQKSLTGDFVLVNHDVDNVAQDLLLIDPNLRLRYSQLGEYWVVFYRDPDTGKEELKFTAKERDRRIVEHAKKLNSPDYNYAEEVERLDREADKAKQEKLNELYADQAERLAHSIRKDYGIQKDSNRSSKSWGKGLRGYKR